LLSTNRAVSAKGVLGIAAHFEKMQDNGTPSGNAMAVTTLLKLTGFANEPRYTELVP
jgi:uncharacterized protein YyaL (SSP411 family)